MEDSLWKKTGSGFPTSIWSPANYYLLKIQYLGGIFAISARVKIDVKKSIKNII
jgi:hypothetical protein